jgi:3-oxoacyl-[acyl-carrier protein] reductase
MIDLMKTDRPKVLITGAASGTGKAAAMRFASEGYDVCMNDVQDMQSVVEALAPGDHIAVRGDYADEKTIIRCCDLIQLHWGRLDVLVNCAGISERTVVTETTTDEWERIFHLMSRGAIQMSNLAISLMNNGGRIIHITSIHGERAEFGSGSYAMAKAAINQYCRNLANELADRNILVNAIAPGFVNTPMSVVNGENELESEWFKSNYVAGHHLPLRRPAQPEEIAGVAFFLAGKDASYITGQVITVDGGLTITF